MRRGNQSRVRGLQPCIEIDHPRFKPLHSCAELVHRFAELVKLLAGTITINLEIPNSLFES